MGVAGDGQRGAACGANLARHSASHGIGAVFELAERSEGGIGGAVGGRNRGVENLGGATTGRGGAGPAQAAADLAALAQLADRAESDAPTIGELAVAQFAAQRRAPLPGAIGTAQGDRSEALAQQRAFAQMAAVCDVTDEAQVQAAFDACAREFGGLDILVASAGIASSAPLEETSVALWRKNYDVLAGGYFLTARAAFPLMKPMKDRGSASIVFIGLENGIAAASNASAYASAKAASPHLARCLALEGAPSGIAIDAIEDRVGPFTIAIPSWGSGRGGMRFAKLPIPGEPTSIHEKLEDCAVVHRLSTMAPRVSPHFPWDRVSDYAALKEVAASLGLASTREATRQQAVEHNIDCIEIGRKPVGLGAAIV